MAMVIWHPVSEAAAFERAKRIAEETGKPVHVAAWNDKSRIIGGVVPAPRAD